MLPHTKYPMPEIRDAPPELTVLVEAYTSARGSTAYLQAFHALRSWLRNSHGVVYISGDRAIRLHQGDLRVGPKGKILAARDGVK